MLQTAAETDDLAAIVSEGAGTRSFGEEMDEFHGVDKWLGLPLLAVKTASVAVFSNTAPPPKLTDLAPRIREPLFVIYAPDGGVETMSPAYYRLARGPKLIWAIPGVGHMGGFDAHPEEYERRVTGFFDRALAKAPYSATASSINALIRAGRPGSAPRNDSASAAFG
jgi:hypothetical protein